MTRDHVTRAINEGIPFVIKMADGREYKVTDGYRISVENTAAVIIDELDLPSVLPLLTMTGISYLKTNGA